jgi:hypothetical protein
MFVPLISRGERPAAARARRREAAAVLAAGLAAGGCSVAHMALPGDFMGHTQVLAARDRSRASGALVDESFALGPYRVSDVERDWSSTDEATHGDVTSSDSVSGYAYVLRGEQVRIDGRCNARAGGAETDLGDGWSLSSNFRARLECECGPVASLKLEHDGESFVGTLGHRSRVYDLRAVTALEGGRAQSQPAGYRVDGDEPLAAVEVQHPGQIWLKPDVDEPARAELSCLMVGLMLYQPPNER